MQILQVRTKALDGTEVKKSVKVKRAWSNISGHAVYLHMDGTYGFKDGAPVRSAEDLKKVIHDKIQLQLALSWWERIGKKQAEAYYDALDMRLKVLAGDHAAGVDAEDAQKDLVLYRRIPSGEAFEDHPTPLTWMEIGFKARPDWWGVAKAIEFNDFLYILHIEDEEPAKPQLPDEIIVGQQQLIDMNAAFLGENEVIVRHIDDELYKEFGPLEVVKTTKKYVEAETAYVEEDKKIYFTGNKDPHAKIPIEALMLVKVTLIESEPKPEGDQTGQSPGPEGDQTGQSPGPEGDQTGQSPGPEGDQTGQSPGPEGDQTGQNPASQPGQTDQEF